MASWININYLDSSLNLPEGPRRIDSLDHLGRLFRGYVRAKKLSNNTTPKEWPFLTPEWRKMTRPKVKQQLGLKSMAMDHTRGSSPGSGTSLLYIQFLRAPSVLEGQPWGTAFTNIGSADRCRRSHLSGSYQPGSRFSRRQYAGTSRSHRPPSF
jgi:hypothetical protein